MPAVITGMHAWWARRRAACTRGPQRRPTKTPVTVRYDPEVVAYFNGTGACCQTRMQDVLCEWVPRRGSA